MAFQCKKPAAIGVKAPYPGFIEPELATSVDRVPSGARWIHEIKFDGYRVQVHLRDAAVKVFTRRGMTGRTALERSLVPDVDASTCLAGCPHGSNPTNTVVAALAADHYGRAIHKDELCAPPIL